MPAKKNESAAKQIESVPKTKGGAQGSFPIVGIGASAGGLEAFEAFFKEMPEDSGNAFVLIAHLDPTHISILPELIQKKTKMKVTQVKDSMEVVPNHVYIIPPNKEMAILSGALQLLEMSKPRGVSLPIDVFFRSLAQDQGRNAICIVLSGTGTDGTLGVRAIKGEGGMAMVQDPETAKYDGMPFNAISTGLADFILPPFKMPETLLNYTKYANRTPTADISKTEEHILNALQKIFILLRAKTEHDFSQYKKNTIIRRIERRMNVHQIDNIEDYVRYLQGSDREISILFRELLIGVTSFFRDPEAYEVLRNKFLPELLKTKPDDYQIRIWVPGCSSGEEAYSIAIIMQECMDALERHFNVQIFGTDIDEEAIDYARIGLYPESISADIDPHRLKKYFIKDENHFQIKKIVREMLVFAPQSIIKDPPFTKLDLLCCRNLLIYFGPDLQKKLLPLFHYSLKEDAILFLGSSETIGQHTDLFTLLHKKWKMFKRNPSETTTHPVLNFPNQGPALKNLEKDAPEPLRPVENINTLKLLKTILLQSDMAPSVVIDDSANIIYIHGRTGRYLEPAEGETSINLLEMARPGLKAGLVNAIRKLSTDRRETQVKGLQVKMNGSHTDVNLLAKPLPDFQTGHRGLMMVTFEETGRYDEKKRHKGTQLKTKSDDVRRLEDELQYTRENLQTTIEELETSNEELKSTNEELQSTNEELQSTNEELETSKEELQSLNEESATVNSELQSRIDELVKANDDIKNLLDATEIATIFLDVELGVRRFTPKATDIFPLTPADIGRPINHFASNLKAVDLHQSAGKVLRNLSKQVVEVGDNAGNSYNMRIRPYRTLNNVIDGVVITLEDITARKLIEKRLRKECETRAAVVQTVGALVVVLDSEGNIIDFSKTCEEMSGYSADEVKGKALWDVLIIPDEFSVVKSTFKRLCAGELPSKHQNYWLTKNGEKKLIVWSNTTTFDHSGNVEAVISTGIEMTDHNGDDKLIESNRKN